MEKKITKRENFEAILELVKDNEELTAFVQHEIELIDNRTAKHKEYRAKKAAEGDALMEAVFETLGDEFVTVDAITEAINATEGYEDITKGKVVARLTKLVNAGRAERGDIKIEKRTVKGYRVAGEATEAETEAE